MMGLAGCVSCLNFIKMLRVTSECLQYKSSLTLGDTFQNLRGCLKPHTVPQYQTLRILLLPMLVVVFSCVRLFVTTWTAAHQASMSFTISQSLLKLMSIESVMPSNHLIPCLPLHLLPSIVSNIRVFSNESALCIMWPKYWSFSFVISPSNEYSGLISFRIDWLDLLAVHGTLKSLLQHHSSKASVLWY